MGLLAWSPEPGDEGLLLFPGEQDDVTEDKERQKQGQNNVAGPGDLCDTAFPTHNFLLESPKGTLPSPYAPPPPCLPTFYPVNSKAHPSAHPWRGLYFKCSRQPRPSEQCGWFCQSKTCQRHGGQMPKSAGHALGGRGEDVEARERKRHGEKA